MTEKEMFNVLVRLSPLMNFVNIETGSTTKGIPDVYYYSQLNSATGWIELKIAHYKNGKIFIDYRPGQRWFLQDHHIVNKKTFCLIWYDEYYYLTKDFSSEFLTKYHLQTSSVFYGKDLQTVNFIKCLIDRY